ncbi:hypothetical protein ACH3XW_15645 [Acanthocheilonema viteae]
MVSRCVPPEGNYRWCGLKLVLSSRLPFPCNCRPTIIAKILSIAYSANSQLINTSILIIAIQLSALPTPQKLSRQIYVTNNSSIRAAHRRIYVVSSLIMPLSRRLFYHSFIDTMNNFNRRL